MQYEDCEALLRSRRDLVSKVSVPQNDVEAEGGCGVLGFAANVPISGRHVITASEQMHNRGNGKGGGIALAGLDPVAMGVSAKVLASHYLIQIAYLDEGVRAAVERECLFDRFDCAESYVVESVSDFRSVPGLEVQPPAVVRYFCRAKPQELSRFAEQHGLRQLRARQVEDELVFQNSFRLNHRYYAGDDKRAFVLSHARDLLVFKIVGYAEQAARYYRLDDLGAHVWIAHQRYPTKGRVWHPGGAHPFVGVNEALVHNGDFANYHRVCEYLRQRDIVPLFSTDTEVSALLFDLWDRVYGYPLEVVLEALAPTSERDFDLLPAKKQELYRAVQQTHLQASPDGPWFFIVARSKPDSGAWQLLGITDTSMLRPQVFALSENVTDAGRVQIGLIASERQAINACLQSLAGEDKRFLAIADRYWVARGGSHTDGGAFAFTVERQGTAYSMTCQDKFGHAVRIEQADAAVAGAAVMDPKSVEVPPIIEDTAVWLPAALPALTAMDMAGLKRWLDGLATTGDDARSTVLAALMALRDRRFDPGPKKRAAILVAIDAKLYGLLRAVPLLGEGASRHQRLDAKHLDRLRGPREKEQVLVLDARGFAPEGEDAAARWLEKAYSAGWRRFIAFDWRGGRFAGCGLGPLARGGGEARIDILGEPGDYLGSGLCAHELVVHGDAQDQIGQVQKGGRVIIHGDVGQTLLYGAKGGVVFVLGSAAGRPLINAVGSPRVVINGTCLDYLGESFMAGDPLNGGGFVILNGVSFSDRGELLEMDTPYPGSNLFSLASGGAIYVRDPRHQLDESQLNGGRLSELSAADWKLIEPYLQDNEKLFNIPVRRLLTVDGNELSPEQVYRKVEVMAV